MPGLRQISPALVFPPTHPPIPLVTPSPVALVVLVEAPLGIRALVDLAPAGPFLVDCGLLRLDLGVGPRFRVPEVHPGAVRAPCDFVADPVGIPLIRDLHEPR